MDKNNKNKKAPEINIKNMGIDIDKNEYREIVQSNSAHPEIFGKKHIKNFYDQYRQYKEALKYLRALRYQN